MILYSLVNLSLLMISYLLVSLNHDIQKMILYGLVKMNRSIQESKVCKQLLFYSFNC
jgi:hypothetical protein